MERSRPPSRPALALPPPAILALILLAAAILHRDVVRLPFFADDYLFLEEVRGRSLVAALTAPDTIANYFRPVGRQVYFWLLGRISGESPAVFHAANLMLFLGAIALLYVITLRLAGGIAAAVAASFLALHYAADVPLHWVSGSQDLLAALGALGALALHLAGRRRWAALPLLLALLAKESVALTPLIAIVADRGAGEGWRTAMRRAWPLGAATAAWATLWLATLPQRRGLAPSLGLDPLGVLSIPAHLIHVAAGLEWRGAFAAMGSGLPPLVPLGMVLVAVIVARRESRREDARPVMVGVVWALAASAPLIAVAAIWSAYYYVFALCGAGLALGGLAARGPRGIAVAIVAALAIGSQSGRAATEFATGRGPWTFQSHVNRHYVDRATGLIARNLAALKRARPTVPPRTTFFFAGVPAFLAWQAADGPLVRWAYRDTSLRSYYQSDFSLERARRGPVLFFGMANDSLQEEAGDPEQLRGVALRVLLNDRVEAAHDLLVYLTERREATPDIHYFLAWVEWALGDSASAIHHLSRAGLTPSRGPSPELDRARALAGEGRYEPAVRALAKGINQAALDARLHGFLADLQLRAYADDPQARLEALAARVLAPEDATAWMRWGLVQAHDGRHSQAVRSLERALALGVTDSTRAREIHEVIAEMRRAMPGGALAQQELRRRPGEPRRE